MMELIGRKEALLQDRKLAFHFMLSEETEKVNAAKDKLLFYQNQVLDEGRRVGSNNGKSLMQHWCKFASENVEYLRKSTEEWTDFI